MLTLDLALIPFFSANNTTLPVFSLYLSTWQDHLITSDASVNFNTFLQGINKVGLDHIPIVSRSPLIKHSGNGD